MATVRIPVPGLLIPVNIVMGKPPTPREGLPSEKEKGSEVILVLNGNESSPRSERRQSRGTGRSIPL